MKKLFNSWKSRREISKKLEKLLDWAQKSPEILDSMIELAEKTAKDAVLQKIMDETQAKDIDAGFLRKLVESASHGIVIDLTMNNAHVVLRKEDVYDDMARHRFQQLLREKSGSESAIMMPTELR